MTTKARTGFQVPCPKCECNEGLSVRVSDLEVTCGGCGEEVTRADLQQLIDDARRLLAWLAAAETIGGAS